MKYENYEGLAEELIQIKLKEIEEKEQIKILYAVESGSRAWGFASPDSDYDVRFIYARPMEQYLSLAPRKDFIDWELNAVLDISGWDVSKTLQHFHKSNASLFEWVHSPIVYAVSPEWEQIKEISKSYFSCKAAMYHYYGTATSNYQEHLKQEFVKYKKYFYVLRPILACKWIEEKACPPPVLFQNLVEEVLEKDMRELVENLVKQKMQMSESEKGVRIDKLNAYIIDKLAYYKQKAASMKEDRNKDWDRLNQLFLHIIKG